MNSGFIEYVHELKGSGKIRHIGLSSHNPQVAKLVAASGFVDFSNKVQRNTFSPDELVKIADMLQMELVFIDKTVKLENGNKYAIVGSDEGEQQS